MLRTHKHSYNAQKQMLIDRSIIRPIMQALIFSLPMIAILRIGDSIKLSDVLLLILVVAEAIVGRLKISKYIVCLLVFFLAFAVFGYFRINDYEPITVLGGWASGMYATTVYPWISFGQTALYIVGGSVAAKYLFKTELGLMRFQLRYIIIWSGIFLLFFAVPQTRDLVSSIDETGDFLRGSFTEKGPMGLYIVFVYAMILTSQSLAVKEKISKVELSAFVGICILDLVLARSDHGILGFTVFNVGYLLSRKPKEVIRFLPVILVAGAIFLIMFAGTLTKLQLLMRFVGVTKPTSANGRYAGLVLLPILLSSAPYFGVGYGNYIFYRTSLQYASFLPILPKDEPESSYVQMLIETGIIGFLAYVVLVIGVPAYRLWKSKNRIVWPFFVSFVVYLEQGIPNYYQLFLWLFVLLEAIRVSTLSIKHDRRPNDRVGYHMVQLKQPELADSVVG